MDSELLSSVRERLWEQTEIAFFDALHSAARRGATEPHPESAAWLKLLRNTALALFDDAAPLSADSGAAAAPRIGRARRNLLFALLGYGNDGEALFNLLGQPVPETKPAKEGGMIGERRGDPHGGARCSPIRSTAEAATAPRSPDCAAARRSRRRCRTRPTIDAVPPLRSDAGPRRPAGDRPRRRCARACA